jgi:hypothetical protein
MNGKLIGGNCTGKAEFIGFSVHNNGTIGRGWAGALKKTFINLQYTELWDVWMDCGHGASREPFWILNLLFCNEVTGSRWIHLIQNPK